MELFKWRQTSYSLLQDSEERILSKIKTPYKGEYIEIGPYLGEDSCQIWTISLNTNSPNTPLVLVHGLGSGVGLWALNLDTLANSERPIYCFDLLGCGRSTRTNFSTEGEEAEEELIDSIEKWRVQMGLERFILLGHSFGGYLSTSYTLKYPQRVAHLILEDAWGYPEKPENIATKFNLPFWFDGLVKLVKPFNPYLGIRLSGPFGPFIIGNIRNDIVRNFGEYFTDPEEVKCVANYIYHINAQEPASGESAFHCIMDSFGWAKNPHVHRIGGMDKNVCMTMIYGNKSWLHNCRGTHIKEIRKGAFVDIQIIRGAGHEVHVHKKDEFNEIVLKACQMTDELK